MYESIVVLSNYYFKNPIQEFAHVWKVDTERKCQNGFEMSCMSLFDSSFRAKYRFEMMLLDLVLSPSIFRKCKQEKTKDASEFLLFCRL